MNSYTGAVSESYGCANGNACLADSTSPVGACPSPRSILGRRLLAESSLAFHRRASFHAIRLSYATQFQARSRNLWPFECALTSLNLKQVPFPWMPCRRATSSTSSTPKQLAAQTFAARSRKVAWRVLCFDLGFARGGLPRNGPFKFRLRV